jgi:hypothetical protein
MTVTINLEPELESALRDEAARQGVDTSTFIITALEDVAQRMGRLPRRPMTEAELLQEISRGLSAETWQRYRDLNRKRRAETLTPDEHRELIALGDQIEQMHAHRMERALELARLKGVSFDSILQQLGITPVPVEPEDE